MPEASGVEFEKGVYRVGYERVRERESEGASLRSKEG
jgi:hypothetical protein